MKYKRKHALHLHSLYNLILLWEWKKRITKILSVKIAPKCKTNDFHPLRSFCVHEKLLPLLFFICLILFCLLVFPCDVTCFCTLKIFCKEKKIQSWNCPNNLIYSTTFPGIEISVIGASVVGAVTFSHFLYLKLTWQTYLTLTSASAIKTIQKYNSNGFQIWPNLNIPIKIHTLLPSCNYQHFFGHFLYFFNVL